MLRCLAISLSVLVSGGTFAPADKHKLKEAVGSWVNNATNASYIFGDISKWDVSKVTDMSGMFSATPLFGTFAGDLSKWDVSKVTNMDSMFSWSKFNGDLSKWDVSKVTLMNSMFFFSTFNGDLSTWDVSKVTEMQGMFEESKFNGDLSQWDVSKVTSMNSMFLDSGYEGDLSKWDVSKVTNMKSMFLESRFNGDLSKWNVSEGAAIDGMFSHASCSLCDHVPHRLESPCWLECASPKACLHAWNPNECNDHVQCAWCESTDQVHKLCFSKGLKPPQSGWVCKGNDAAFGVLARKLPLVMI